MAVQRVVRGVEVEDDLLGRPVVRLSNRSTNRASIAAGSCAILRYFAWRREVLRILWGAV